ncbi:MAG: TIM barrel protein [Lachnospiraceae bacterium]|nr:TIM barrel protein [Lachnospiraceae bacterium]
MNDPKIYLALDSCFALKRWVEPETWGPLIRDMGYTSVQVSTDNEFDPLYSTKEYREEWIRRTKKMSEETGLQVRSLYTGYQTYRTCGFCQPVQSEVDKLISGWVKPAIDIVGQFDCDMGFSLHCLTEKQMQDPEEYYRIHEKLYKIYSDIAAYGKEHGVQPCMEAMYVPRQTPWTIQGTEDFLKKVYAIDRNPMYTTVDVGHMIGQRKFRRPNVEQIRESINQADKKHAVCKIWLGPDKAYDVWKEAVDGKKSVEEAIDEINRIEDEYPFDFSTDTRDDDPYEWLKALGCYSPIMHLQQCTATTGGHRPFTPENNKTGIIDGKKLLEAIAESYQRNIEGMPPKTDRIVLGLELFTTNIDLPGEIIDNMTETCQYWRQFIPEDGLSLSELLKRIS